MIHCNFQSIFQTNHLYFHRRPLSFFFPFAEKIKDMFPKDSLNHTILVLVNAVYFKGQWDTKFDTKNTVEKEFWLDKVL